MGQCAKGIDKSEYNEEKGETVKSEGNDIDKSQNDIYGWRKYRSMSLSTFSSITSLQLFKKYLDDNKYDKALQIANMFKLNTDKAYQAQYKRLAWSPGCCIIVRCDSVRGV